MKKKGIIWNMAKSLVFVAVMATGLTACVDNGDNPAEISDQDGINSKNFEDPTTDEMAISVNDNMPAAVISQFSESSMGAALVRRLKDPTDDINDNTKLLLLKASDFSKLSEQQWLALAKLMRKGGYIAIEKPTNQQMLALGLTLVAVLLQAEEDLLTADGDIRINDETPAAARQVASAAEERMKARLQNIQSRTRGSIEDALKKVVAEMVILGWDSYYVCESFNEAKALFAITDGNGNTTMEEDTAPIQEYSKFRSGLMADGAALWLNTRGQAKQERQAKARQLQQTRGDADGCINDLMSASDEFTYQKKLYSRSSDGGGMYKENAFHETIAVWGVHNTAKNKDYYYVQQKVRMEIGGKKDDNEVWDPNKTLYRGPYEAHMWYVNSFTYQGKTYTHYYGSWLNKYLSKLNLTGEGTIKVEKAIPLTDNNNVSESIAIGESHSETNTLGFSLGGSIGSGGAAFIPSFNYSHGWTDGTSFTMTTTTNAKELKCVKNTNGSEVTWTYECGKTMDPYKNNKDKWCHPMAPDALTNDVDIENQVCWSVSNPSGSYKLSIYEQPYMKAVMKVSGKGEWCNMTGWMTYEKEFTFKTPNRAVQEWYMDITFPEIGTEGHHGDKGKLIEYLQRQFPDIYQTRQSLADQTDTSENTIKYLVDYSKSLLLNSDGAQTMRDYALDLGLSQYTIKWYTIDKKHKTYELTIKARE